MSEARLLYNHVVDSLPNKHDRDAIRTYVQMIDDCNGCINSRQNYSYCKSILKCCNKSHYKPEETMKPDFQITEELARGIFKIAETSIEIDGDSADNFVRSMKCSGYIKKNIVEEAEEMYEEYGKAERRNLLNVKQHEAIQYLKEKQK